MEEVLAPTRKMNGRDYADSITTTLKGMKQDAGSVLFDARATLENPNYKFSVDNRAEWKVRVAEIEEIINDFKAIVGIK